MTGSPSGPTRYRDQMHPADLADPQLLVESRRELNEILDQKQVFSPLPALVGDIYLQNMPAAHPPRSRISAAGNRRDSGASSEPSWTA